MKTRFEAEFAGLFQAHYGRVFRYMARLSGDRELASDIVQETFTRLYRRGSLPDIPEAWLITVALNLFRNARAKHARRMRLLEAVREEDLVGDPPAIPTASADTEATGRRVRAALDRLSERERSLLLLRAEGYSYRDIAAALKLRESSVGALLARAKRAFREGYEGSDAS